MKSAKTIAFLLAVAPLAAVAQAQAPTDVYKTWLPPAVADSPALRAFKFAPFANADIKTGETLLQGVFVISTTPNSITLKVVVSTAAGKTQTFDPPQGREIRLTPTTVFWAAQKKRETIDWANVIDYAPVFVIGTNGADGNFTARKVDIVDGYVGDLLKDPEFQKRLKDVQNEQNLREELRGDDLPDNSIWLESLDTSRMTAGFARPQIAKSVDSKTLILGGQAYSHGVGTHAESDFLIDLKGRATRFVSMVGVDDEMTSRGSVVFSVWADGRKVGGSTIMRVGDEPELIDVDLTDVKTLRLQISDAGDSNNSDHADWAGARLELTPQTDLKNLGSLPVSINYSTVNIPNPPDFEALFSPTAPPDYLWVDALDLQKMTSGFKRPNAAKSIDGNPIRLAGRVYPHGVGTHAPSRFAVALNGTATRFLANVGIDEEINSVGSVIFSVWVDGQEMANTGAVKAGEQPRQISVNLTGASILELRADNDGDNNSDHADWGGALIQLVPNTGTAEVPVATDLPELEEE